MMTHSMIEVFIAVVDLVSRPDVYVSFLHYLSISRDEVELAWSFTLCVRLMIVAILLTSHEMTPRSLQLMSRNPKSSLLFGPGFDLEVYRSLLKGNRPVSRGRLLRAYYFGPSVWVLNLRGNWTQVSLNLEHC